MTKERRLAGLKARETVLKNKRKRSKAAKKAWESRCKWQK